MKRQIKFITIFFFIEILICNGQTPSHFHGLPVIPYETPLANWEARYIEANLARQIDLNTLKKRERALDFFNIMNRIAEPSTLSFFGDYTHNTNSIYQKKPFVLEANVQIPISIGGKQWGLNTIQIVPQFKVRIFQDDKSQGDSSLPVRTPSYIPGLFYYFSLPCLWQKDLVTKDIKGWFSGFHVFHHSNGQDGREFAPDGKINFYNGNFSELVVGEFIIGHIHEFNQSEQSTDVPGTEHPSLKTLHTNLINSGGLFYWHASYEFHEGFATDSAFNKYNLYGRHRINIQIGYSHIPAYVDIILNKLGTAYYAVTPRQSKEAWRVVINANYIADIIYNSGDMNSQTRVSMLNLGKRLNLYCSIYWRIPGAPNASLFLEGGYYGSDPYNIYFQQSFWQIRTGFGFAFFKYPKSGDLQKTVYNLE